MPEDLNVNCFKCADLYFARNLVAQMREGDGRHNSAQTPQLRNSTGFTAREWQSMTGQIWRENQEARA